MSEAVEAVIEAAPEVAPAAEESNVPSGASESIGSEAIADSGLNQVSEEAAGAIEELGEAVEEAIEEGATEAEVQSLIETFKIKVNGEEKDIELDWNNKEDIVRRLQMAEAGQGAMQRSAELEKVFDTELGRLQDDPMAVLEEMGFNLDEMAEQRIQRKIDELSKSPEEKAREEALKVQGEKDAELEKLRSQIKEQEIAQLQRQYEIDLGKEIETAISATSELPKGRYTMKQVTNVMMDAMRNGIEMSADDAVRNVAGTMKTDIQDLLDAMPDEVLRSYLGKNNNDRLRKKRLADAKAAPPASTIKDTGAISKPESGPKRKIGMQEFLKYGIKGDPRKS